MLPGRRHRRTGVFPPVNSGGLIEAPASRFWVAAVIALKRANHASFPPVNSGGLIEAQLITARESGDEVTVSSLVSAGEFRRPH